MLVYYDGEKAEIFFVESLEIEWSDEEIEYSKLWKTFRELLTTNTLRVLEPRVF